jgi:hypothetical protein
MIADVKAMVNFVWHACDLHHAQDSPIRSPLLISRIDWAGLKAVYDAAFPSLTRPRPAGRADIADSHGL